MHIAGNFRRARLWIGAGFRALAASRQAQKLLRRKIEGFEAFSPAPMQRLRRTPMRICRNGKTSGTALKRRREFRLEIILRKKRRSRNAAAYFQPISDIPSYGAFFAISESSATLSGNAITMRPPAYRQHITPSIPLPPARRAPPAGNPEISAHPSQFGICRLAAKKPSATGSDAETLLRITAPFGF